MQHTPRTPGLNAVATRQKDRKVQSPEARGARMITQPIIPPDHGEHGCYGKKTDGDWCGAYPVVGQKFCVGHMRSLSGDTSGD